MAGIAIIALLGMPTAAVAVDSNAVQHFKHYIDCLGWLLTDLPTHEANCTPGRPFEFPDPQGGDGLPTTIRLISPSAFSDEAPTSSGSSAPPSSSESEPPSESSEEPSCQTQECPPPCNDPYSCQPV